MKLIVIAPRGNMGRAITRLAAEDPQITLVGGVGRQGSDIIGKDLGIVALTGKELQLPVSDSLENIIASCDAIIDFSTTENSLEILRVAVQHKKALVCGTTGFSAEEFRQFEEASKSIPVLYAANTSKMFDIFSRIVELCTEALPEADIDIIDIHSRYKVDAPSGTALELAERLAELRQQKLEDVAIFGRKGVSPRKPSDISFHSLRTGNVPSSHQVVFGIPGERMELTHHGQDMDCYASGAIACAKFLLTKEPGLYTAREAFTAK